jgi:universal stress protein A
MGILSKLATIAAQRDYRMFRFTRILCPVDFDQSSLTALEFAGELAGEEEVSIDVLHVVPIPPGPEVAIPFDKLEGRARTKLERFINQRISPNVRYTVHIRTGDPASEVICMARDSRADLIVMATHGRKGLRRFVLGSVAERVVREAPCAVLTVRPDLRNHAARSKRKPGLTRTGLPD